MRGLLDSGWMRFGSAGRGTYDWVSDLSPSPAIEQRLKGYHRSVPDVNESITNQELIVALVSISLFILGLLLYLIYLKYAKRRRWSTIVNLNSDKNIKMLPSFDLLKSDSTTDVSDAVFLMVYVPAVNEEALTKIARVASMSDSN